MMLGGLALRTWNGLALGVYFVLWFFLLFWAWDQGRRWQRVLPVMWTSLNSARPAHAVWHNSGFGSWSWIWILFNLAMLSRSFSRFSTFPTGSGIEVSLVVMGSVAFIVWLVSKVATEWGSWESKDFMKTARRWESFKYSPEEIQALKRGFMKTDSRWESRLVLEFREIVREPLPEPGDPRFKKWNVQERFPWGWELAQQQLHERLARKGRK